MCASNSVTRSTLARNSPPGARADLSPGRAPARQVFGFGERTPHLLRVRADVDAVRVAALLVAHVRHCAILAGQSRRSHGIRSSGDRARPGGVLRVRLSAVGRARDTLPRARSGHHRQRGVRALLPRADEYARAAGHLRARRSCCSRATCSPLVAAALGRVFIIGRVAVLPRLRAGRRSAATPASC